MTLTLNGLLGSCASLLVTIPVEEDLALPARMPLIWLFVVVGWLLVIGRAPAEQHTDTPSTG